MRITRTLRGFIITSATDTTKNRLNINVTGTALVKGRAVIFKGEVFYLNYIFDDYNNKYIILSVTDSDKNVYRLYTNIPIKKYEVAEEVV